ncbi:hypothetical protein M758_8G030700 [Ceratodon purpureus]|nr:hypothetical protein M758_8G030700 [Ceratodon purpureus]
MPMTTSSPEHKQLPGRSPPNRPLSGASYETPAREFHHRHLPVIQTSPAAPPPHPPPAAAALPPLPTPRPCSPTSRFHPRLLPAAPFTSHQSLPSPPPPSPPHLLPPDLISLPSSKP